MNRNIPSTSLTLALPKQGKLKAPIVTYLEERGFKIEDDNESGILKDTRASNSNQSPLPPIRVEFVRAADALILLQEKVADFAIIGSDIVDEITGGVNPAFPKLKKKFDLEIAQCGFKIALPTKLIQAFASSSTSGELNLALALSTPKDISPLSAWLRDNGVTPATMLNGLKFATSNPNLLSPWLLENGVTPGRILVRDGGVESSVRLGMADAVADLVDTGGTMTKNGLTAVFDITRTSAVCYTSAGVTAKEILVNEFLANLATRRSIPVQKTTSTPLEHVPMVV